ncbi:hypothetical protein [Rubripirellula reticaptiva]|nr:hypothetical protein [Rubripirellula reticaptiva]
MLINDWGNVSELWLEIIGHPRLNDQRADQIEQTRGLQSNAMQNGS